MGQWRRVDGSPASGWVLLSAWRDELLSAQPAEYQLDDDGRVAAPIVVTGTTYVEVQVLLDDTGPQGWVIVVDGTTAVVDVLDAPRLPGKSGDGAELAVPWSAVGAAGGVAPLDAAGRVPAAHLPPGGGGGEVIAPVVFGYGPPPSDLQLLPGQMYLDQASFLVYR